MLDSSAPTIREIFNDIRRRGYKPVPVSRETKSPYHHEWQKRDFALSDFKPTDNGGAQMGEVSNGLTDVDLDCPEAVELAPHFLPRTGSIYGRHKKPKSHYLYIGSDPDEKGSLQFDDETGAMVV